MNLLSLRPLERNLFFWGMLASIYVVSWMMQATLMIRSDVSILMHEAMQLMAGAQYAKDLYETDPPLILYLCMPPVLFMKYWHLSVFIAWRLYVFFLASFSLLICQFFMKKIFAWEDERITILLLLTIATIFVFLPLGDFGQRDHLLLIFTMPYLLLLTCRLENNAVSLKVVMLVGVLAAIGFSIKPQYLLALFLLEGYVICYQRRVLSMIRPETLVIAACLIVYVLSIFIFHSDYVFVIVPMVSRVYYSGLGTPWRDLLTYSNALYCGLPMIFFMIQYHNNPQKVFSSILLIAMFSYLLVYLIQDTAWYYHILPAFSMALLLFVQLFVQFVLQPQVGLRDYIRLAMFGVLLFGFIVFFKETIWVSIIFFHGVFFGLFALLFAALFFLAEKNSSIAKVIVATPVIIGMAYLFAYFAQHTDWYAHRFILTIMLLILLFSVFVARSGEKRAHFAFAAILGMLIFAYPAYEGNIMYSSYLLYTEQSHKLINFMHDYAKNKSVYFLSSQIAAYPFIDYAGVNYVSKYPMLIWVPSLVKQSLQPISDKVKLQILKDKSYYIGSIADELNNNKPQFVFVDVEKFAFDKMHYDYVKEFSQNLKFAEAWKDYRYLTIVEQKPEYRLAVYQRIAG